MPRLAIVAALALAPAAAHAAVPTVRLAAAPDRPGWFACDALDGPLAAFVATPGADRAAVITLIDRATGRATTQTYTVGPPGPGAGQVYWSLTQGGRPAGQIHGINPGMVTGSGPDALPPIVSLTLGRQSLRCRWLGNMRFLGIGATRTVAITGEDGKLTYRSYDVATRGSPIDGNEGVQTDKPALVATGGWTTGAGQWRFSSGDATLLVSTRGGRGAGGVSVTKDGKPAGDTPFLMTAWVDAGAKLSRADVWSGAGIDACRKGNPGEWVDACVIAAMRRTGATSQAIAFARWIEPQDTVGYLSAWKQAGPIGIATITFPFRANTNDEPALIQSDGAGIFPDRWEPTPADEARPDWRRLVAAHPQSGAFPPGVVTVGRIVPGRPFAVTVRTPWADCHACAPNGAQTVRYDFSAAGRLTGSGLVAVR